MFAPHVARWRPSPALVASTLMIVCPILVAGVMSAIAQAPSDLPAASAAAAVTVFWYGGRLARLAASQRENRTGAGRARGAGLLGLGFLTVAATSLGLAILVSLGGAARPSAHLGMAGLTVVMMVFAPGLLLMPGAAPNPVARLRRALDGVGLGVWLLFTTWLLVVAPQGRIDSLDFWAAVLSCCGLSLAVITALRVRHGRNATTACAAAVVAAVLGLDGLTFALENGYRPPWPSVCAALLALAAGLAWYGVRHLPSLPDSAPAEPTATLSMYPVLGIPVAAAIVVAVHRAISGGAFDRPSLVLGVLGLCVLAAREMLAALDVSRYAQRIERQEAQFRSLVAGSSDVIMVLDDELVVRWQSPAAARQFGLSDQDAVGRHFPAMLHPADAVLMAQRLADVRAGIGGLGVEHPALVEARLRDGFGQWRETESSIRDQRDVPEVGGIVVHIRDIAERKEMERGLHRLAYTDPLTGLANRRQVLLSLIQLRATAPARGALLLIELDGFSALNDVRGYDVGDAVLVEVARRLRAAVGVGDVPGRLSGDAFAVATPAYPVAAYALATRLVTVLAEPITLPGTVIRLTGCVGVAEIAGAASSDDVLRRADLALHRAKQLGRGRVEWYDEEVERALVRRMTVEQELPGALDRGEFDLLYQPILDLVARRPLGVEALLRWRHPRLGTLLPAEVLPVAEQLGLIGDVGAWVLDEATRQLGRWLREGRDLTMAINVSPDQMCPELPATVAATLRSYRVPAERLVIELGESRLAPDPTFAQAGLAQLRALGARTALDEFGAGVESLTHLRRLPVDIVKVGPSIFAAGPEQSVPIIDVMVGLGRRLGIDVVAQGLESEGQLEVVRGAGCRLGQGHFFARPQPAERIEAYLDGFPAR